jgi:predicted acetyltransferase
VTVDVARKLLPVIFDEVRLQRPGELARWDLRWDMNLGLIELPGRPRWQGWVAVHRNVDGRPDGFARYHVEEQWADRVHQSTLVVDELAGVGPSVEADLWRFAFGVDLIATIKATTRSPDDLLPWLLTDKRAAKMTERGDFVWVRILDVPAALGGRAYDRTGSVVLEVTDELGLAGGRFVLDAGPDGADCRPTDAEPDLTLPVAVLGSVLLGGVPLRTLAAAGQVDVHDPGALTTADGLFRWPITPYCSTWF